MFGIRVHKDHVVDFVDGDCIGYPLFPEVDELAAAAVDGAGVKGGSKSDAQVAHGILSLWALWVLILKSLKLWISRLRGL